MEPSSDADNVQVEEVVTDRDYALRAVLVEGFGRIADVADEMINEINSL